MRVPLNGAAYEARSIIANAQRCVNLYPELNQKDAPVKLTHYPTPGLQLLDDSQIASGYRCLYRATNGDLFGVIGTQVFFIDRSWTPHLLGNITPGDGLVYMVDNGLVIAVVDGSPRGWAIDMGITRQFGLIVSDAFYGADRVDYVDTYFLFNKPDSTQWYWSLSQVDYAMLVGGTAFDALDIAAKSGYADKIVTLIVMHREIWLLGSLTTEIWYNSGAADSTFQSLPGAYIEHGCKAKDTIAKQDLCVYWLSQDLQGRVIVLKGASYTAARISTHAIENEFSSYTVINDAIGFTYQQEGHVFYQLTFPTEQKTWVWDESTKLWHERAWTDDDGNLLRHRANCSVNAYDTNVVGDWQTGKLYKYDLDTYTDNGQPISRIRGFPHLLNDGRRISYSQFIADVQVGTDTGEIGGSYYTNPPQMYLRWSDTRGASWSNRIGQSMGAVGEYYKQVQYQRLGLARDRVFELSWSIPTKTALNGAFVQYTLAET